ncbi:helix-turn-helix transcriptional regulator [Halorussus marinus]|uniref:helix-turn-helix transcriptional regulator n=1 Tax=Halorussus marinus TaxID=2505976 RepID=UPI001091B753|nr:hypothetical protein [Halorussus marinus]
MGARQFGAVLAVVVCLTAAVGGPGVTAAASQTATPDVTADTIILDVQVHENGTATWAVAYRTRLDDGETAAAFESLRDDVENNSTEYTDQFTDRMASTIASAERATGRNMTGENYTVDAEIRQFPQRYGVVTYSFQWHQFADTAGDRLRIGDAIGGLPLDDKTRLLISWPQSYEATAIRPPPDEERNGTAVWIGELTFGRDEPRIVVAPPATGPQVPWRAVGAAVGALGVLGAAVAGGWWLYRREEVGDPDDDMPEELLSNEERVLRLLERRGGRVKQKAIVEELGWTEAKTSQVVGSLREQGKIESFRLGRENVLALPQEEL